MTFQATTTTTEEGEGETVEIRGEIGGDTSCDGPMAAAIVTLACAAAFLPPAPSTSGAASAHAAVGPSLTARLQAAAAAVALSGALTLGGGCPALAVGPEQIPLKIQSYEEVKCPPELAQGSHRRE